MKKLQVIVIVLFISLTICTLANFQVKAQGATIGTAGKMQSNRVFMAQKMEPRWLKRFEPSLTCTATINPTTANAGETKTYVIQIVNLQNAFPGYSGGTLKCANITIPSGFSSVTVTSAKHYDSNGNLKTTWNYGADASQIWVWEGSQGGDDASQGQYVNVTFSAKAPTIMGTYTWTTYVYKNAPSSSPFIWPNICNSLGAVYGSQPTVTVSTAAGATTHLVVLSGTSQVAGTPFTVTVTAEDAHGNTATGYTGTVHFTSSDGQAVLPANSVLSSGTGTFSVTLKTAGSQSITATDTVTSSITGSQSGITVSHAAAASSVVISPAGASVTAGASQTYSAMATDAYGNTWDVTSLTTWSISSGAGGSWSNNVYTSATAGSWTVTGTYETITATAQLTVNAITYQITVIQGAHGTIVPGTTTVDFGATPSFTITPDAGYHIASITANGASVTVTSPSGQTYQFTAVSTDGSLTATFAINNYDVTVNVGADGSSNLASQTVNWNTQLNFVLTPDAGYSVSNVAVNGTSVGTVTSISLTITGDTTVSVNFAINTYSLTVNVGTDGSSNIASQTVNWGSAENFAFTPDTGYSIADVVVNGTIDEGAITSLSLTITGPTTVSVNFAINTYTITVTQTTNGQIAPGTSTVNYGATPNFSITPNTGYHITSITANRASVTVTSPSGQTYQFSAVSTDGSLTATFAISTYTITVTQGANGVISPDTSTVDYGGSQTFTITPNTGYSIASLTVDGSPFAVASSYAFSNVQAPHTISATFAITSTTPIGSSPSPTPKESSPSPTPKESSPSPTPKESSPSPTPASQHHCMWCLSRL